MESGVSYARDQRSVRYAAAPARRGRGVSTLVRPQRELQSTQEAPFNLAHRHTDHITEYSEKPQTIKVKKPLCPWHISSTIAYSVASEYHFKDRITSFTAGNSPKTLNFGTGEGQVDKMLGRRAGGRLALTSM